MDIYFNADGQLPNNVSFSNLKRCVQIWKLFYSLSKLFLLKETQPSRREKKITYGSEIHRQMTSVLANTVLLEVN